MAGKKEVEGAAAAAPVSASIDGPPRKVVASILKSVNKKLGADSVTLYDPADPKFSVPYWIPTGAPDLDSKLGGGLAGGRIIELFSNSESEGKTSIAASIARGCQEKGGLVVWYDSENTVLPEYFKDFGLKVDDIAFMPIQTLEKFFEVVETFSLEMAQEAPGTPVLFVLDSVAAAQTVSQEEADYDKAQVASTARVMSGALRKVAPVLAQTGGTLLLVNQSRMKIGVMYGDPNDTPGGKAMKFYASQRIALRRCGRITSDGSKTGAQIGIEVEAHIVKNKVAVPFGKSKFKLLFGKGVSFAESAFELLKRRNVVTGGSGGRYQMPSFVDGSFGMADFPSLLTHSAIHAEVIRQSTIKDAIVVMEIDPALLDASEE